jgi:hypothetical protein
MKRSKSFILEGIAEILSVYKYDIETYVSTTRGHFNIGSCYSKPKVGEIYRQGSDKEGWALKFDAKLTRKKRYLDKK